MTLPIVLLILGGLLSIGNAINWLRSRSGQTFHSRVPLLGAGFGVVACLSNPDWRAFAWLPILLDVGTLELVWQLPEIARREARYSDSRRIAEFALFLEDRQIRLTLYREDIALLRQRLTDKHGEQRYEGGTCGHWSFSDHDSLRFIPDYGASGCLSFDIQAKGEQLMCATDSLLSFIPDGSLNLQGLCLTRVFGTLNTT